ncbi:MAG: DEAD/DEAH box helicase [Candidatus Aenigmarchaeota archaeon]|nr:DEAD/DEAH box helicase [Candidatus Aenigmarchaeota archaeon]
MPQKTAPESGVFSLLEPKLRELVGKRFRRPTPIQEQVVPAILSGSNALVISETGSGKTESALLPLFNFLMKRQHKPVAILYITPLRSLNRDILKRIMWWANHLDFEVSVRHGDTSAYERRMQKEDPPDMLIVTPETLQAILTARLMREHLKNVRYVVIDEVHELVSSKRGLQLAVGLERLKGLVAGNGGSPQIIELSATVGSPQAVLEFFNLHKGDAKIINMSESKRIKVKVESPKPVREDKALGERIFIGPATAARLRRIRQLIMEKKSVLAFTNTREFAEILSSRIRGLDAALPVDTHHSSLSKHVRIDAEERFKSEEIKALICTSSLELGIDIGAIDFVIQYMSPRQASKLIQRIGRAGHSLERVSEGAIISTDADDCLEATAIASLAMQGWIEKTLTYPKAWDVLAHQMVGMGLDSYMPSLGSIYSLVKGAWPFRDMSEDEFWGVCLLIERLRLIWINSDAREQRPEKAPENLEGYRLKLRKYAWQYYYENLTTIPNIRNYLIVNMVTNKPVGTLDAEFVAMHGSQGTSFICKGQAWKVISATEDRVYVEPLHGMEAAIPAWEGELIPVPFEVAQSVGELRSEIEGLLEGHGKSNAVKMLAEKYPITADTARKMCILVSKQMKFGAVPEKDELLVEHYSADGEYWAVIHSCLGSLANDTIGRVLSFLLIGKLGSVGLQTDPYRIMLRLQKNDFKAVLDTLKGMEPGDVGRILRHTLPDTELFRWRFMHVAQRLGIVSKDADYRKAYIKKIVENYAGTPAFDEALNEVMTEKLDVGRACEILEEIRNGRIKIRMVQGLSPMGESGLKRKYEIIATRRAEGEIFDAFSRRLLDTKLGMVCTNCGSLVRACSVENIPDKAECKRCKARLISIVPYRHAEEASRLMRDHLLQKKMPKEEGKYIGWMQTTASLYISHGRDAAMALAGRGVGPRTAARLLSKGHKGSDLLRDILDAERNYIRTRVFWKG